MKLKIIKSLSLLLLCSLLLHIVLARFLLDQSKTAGDAAAPASAEPALAEDTTVEGEPEAVEEPYSDIPDIDISSWQLRLVNSEHLLDADFSPELSEIASGHSFDTRAAEHLQLFIEAARSEGHTAYIISSYRPYSVQKALYDKKITEYLFIEGSQEAAEEKAKTIVSYPGSSEHQLGLACDITDRYYEYMNETLENTALFGWLSEHCAEYGFILRYPKDKQEITGIMYEPWHFRYVGTEAALYIREKGLCLEEFILLYR